MLYHPSYTTALLQLIATAGALANATFSVIQAAPMASAALDITHRVWVAQQDQAAYSAQAITHTVDNEGEIEVYSVEAGDIQLGYILVWVDAQGTVIRAYPVQEYTA